MGISEKNLFHNTLAKMADELDNFDIQKDSMVYGSHGERTKVVEFAVNYLVEHRTMIKEGDREAIVKLSQQVGSSSKNDKTQQIFNYLLGKKHSLSDDEVSDLDAIHTTEHIVVQVASPPKNPQKLRENLELVKNNPHFTLTSELAVIDTQQGQLPIGWSPAAIVSRLEIEGEKSENVDLKQLFFEVAGLYQIVTNKPLAIVLLNEKGGDSGALKCAIDVIIDKLPVLTTVAMLQQYPKLQKKGIYLQENGSLVAILPPGTTLEQAGLSNEFKMWKAKKPIPEIKTNFVQDLERLFSTEPTQRSIYWVGHGMPETTETQSRIADLTPEEFQKSLELLGKANMNFLMLDTCFSGGENIHSIHLPSGDVPCPIVVRCSSEAVAIGTSNTLGRVEEMLQGAHEMIFPKQASGKSNSKRHELSDSEIVQLTLAPEKINALFGPSTITMNLHNIPSVLLPSQNGDKPRLVYSEVQLPDMDDIDSLKKPEYVTDASAYFFSKSIIPAKIENPSTTKGLLLARGGNSHHIIKELDMPQVPVAELALGTFNALMQFPIGSPMKFLGANKLYIIPKMNTLEGQLRDVMLYKSAREARLLYKKEGEETYTLIRFFPTTGGTFDPMGFKQLSEEEKISPEEYQYQLTLNMLSSTASKKKGSNDVKFDEFLNSSLSIPRNSLYESIRTGGPLDLKGASEETQSNALVIAVEAGNKIAISTLLENNADPSKAVFHAAAKGNIDILKLILAKTANINLQDSNGRTPLQIAVFENQAKAIALLLENGADPNLGDLAGCTPLHYAAMNDKWEIIRRLLKHGGDPNNLACEGRLHPVLCGSSNGFAVWNEECLDRIDLEKLFRLAIVQGEIESIEKMLELGWKMPDSLKSSLHDWCLEHFEQGAKIMVLVDLPFKKEAMNLWQDELIKNIKTPSASKLIQKGLRIREDQKKQWMSAVLSDINDASNLVKGYSYNWKDYKKDYYKNKYFDQTAFAIIALNMFHEEMKTNSALKQEFFEILVENEDEIYISNPDFWLKVIELGGGEKFKNSIISSAISEYYDNHNLAEALIKAVDPNDKEFNDRLFERILKSNSYQLFDYLGAQGKAFDPKSIASEDHLKSILEIGVFTKKSRKMARWLLEKGTTPKIDNNQMYKLIENAEWKILGLLETKANMRISPNDPLLQQKLLESVLKGNWAQAKKGLIPYGVKLPPLTPNQHSEIQGVFLKKIEKNDDIGLAKSLGIVFDPHSERAADLLSRVLADPTSNSSKPTIINLLDLGVPLNPKSAAARKALEKAIQWNITNLEDVLSKHGVKLVHSSKQLKEYITSQNSFDQILARELIEHGVDWKPKSQELEQLITEAFERKDEFKLKYALSHGGNVEFYREKMKEVVAECINYSDSFLRVLTDYDIAFDVNPSDLAKLFVGGINNPTLMAVVQKIKPSKLTLTEKQWESITLKLSLERINLLEKWGVSLKEIAQHIPSIPPEWLSSNWELAMLLLNANVKIDINDHKVRSALNKLISAGAIQKAQFLLDLGVKPLPESIDKDIRSALSLNQPQGAKMLAKQK